MGKEASGVHDLEAMRGEGRARLVREFNEMQPRLAALMEKEDLTPPEQAELDRLFDRTVKLVAEIRAMRKGKVAPAAERRAA